MIVNFFKKADSYGQEFNFHIPEYGDHRSVLGGIITILYWVGIIYCTFCFGQDIIHKRNPIFMKETIILNDAPYLDLNDSITNFTVYFNLIDSGNRIYISFII